MRGLRNVAAGLVVLGVVGFVTWPVYAHCGKCAADCKSMVKKMEEGKTSLAKAIEAAEAHSKGKAVGAMGELEAGKFGVEVYCMVGDKLMEVDVDGTGKATGMKEAKAMGEAEPAKKGG